MHHAHVDDVVDDVWQDRILRAFGQNVRAARERAALSQEQLASAAGLHRTYVGSLERGERNVSIVNIHKLAQALKVPPGDLLALDQATPHPS